MNLKSTIITSITVVTLVATISYLNLSKSTKESAYTPIDYKNSDLYSGPEKVNAYLNMLRGNPQTGVVDPNDYLLAQQQAQKLSAKKNKAALGMVWEQMGPDNVGGRGRAILVDRNNPNTIYAGSVAGGLFVSHNNGNTWTEINRLADNNAISCITQTTNGRIFFGTGSTFESMDGTGLGSPGFPGNGVYEYVPSTQTVVPILVNNVIPVNSTTGSLVKVNAIGARGNRLYLGLKQGTGLVYADPDGNGIYPSTLSGWTNPVIIPNSPNLPENSEVQDIDVATDGSMLVCYSGKIYTSPDGSPNSFSRTLVNGGNRISGAIAPSDPNVMYIVSTNAAQVLNIGTTSNPRGLEVSLDKGATWTTVVPGGVPSIDPFVQLSGTGGQGGWDQAIGVDPSNPDRVLIGGIQFYEFQLNRSQSPLGGNWFRAAVLNEFATPFYIHADNHSMFWKDANTVFVIGDGGVFRSTDGGASWLHMNLGFNVTTFFHVATASNGMFMGGAQDNGTQLFDFGQMGSISPKGTVEIQGGDGFAVEFSDFGGGIAFASSQNGAVMRYSAQNPGQGGGQFFDSELLAWTQYPFNTKFRLWESVNDPLSIDSINITFQDTTTLPAGTAIVYQSLTNSEDLYYTPTVTTTYFPGDTLKLQDYYQSRFAFYIGGGHVHLTKDATRLNASNFDWHRVATGIGEAVALEFSPDGNHLYIGNTFGQIYRVSGLATGNTDDNLDVRTTGTLLTTKTLIASGLGGVVTGISIDPNNGENMIATVGNYGVTNHVYRSTTAESATSTGGVTAIQGPTNPSTNGFLPRMPVYDAEIDMNDPNIVLIGTDFGVWATSNAFSAASGNLVEWYSENANGMAHVPTFEIKQQYKNPGLAFGNATNSQMYYLGTHGRGFYRSGSRIINTVGVDEIKTNMNQFDATLGLYPNPISNNGTIDINLNSQTKAVIKVYNLSGAIVKIIDLGTLVKGKHKIAFNAAELSTGTYIMVLDGGNVQKVTKFIVNR